MPKRTPGSKASIIAARKYRKEQRERAAKNRERKAVQLWKNLDGYQGLPAELRAAWPEAQGQDAARTGLSQPPSRTSRWR
jgi:hypothetical protein